MSLVVPEIKFLNSDQLPAAVKILNQEILYPVGCNNWPEQFPGTPEVGFRIAHNGTHLFIKFTVTEKYTLARIKEDNGEVWTDSCVEFFLATDDSGYYNFEFTCIGKALLGFRKERPAAVHAPSEIMHTIKRFPTLGTGNFDEKQLAAPWELTVAIPATALFRHQFDNWKGIVAKANVYKCGDKLSEPHYLSWKPIDTPKPDFHIPRCFAEIRF